MIGFQQNNRKAKLAKSYLSTILKKVKSKVRDTFRPKSPYLPGFWERTRIENYPRRRSFTSKLLSRNILISDSKWYLPTLKEIWDKEIYRFESNTTAPYIIDCGANIGLSVIYWKHLFPKAKILAFEPDPEIFNLLSKNVITFGYEDVDLRQLAVWTEETDLSFHSDNSVGGRLEIGNKSADLIKVKTIRLHDLLSQHIDMLKIDIEGAEHAVLMDCSDRLLNVEKLFVEYHGAPNETQKLQVILDILQRHGFRYHIKEANPVKHPFIRSERNTYYDLQLNIFAFRD